MHTKLRIDLSQGIIDIEGEDQFVREIYADFKDSLMSKAGNQDRNSDASTSVTSASTTTVSSRKPSSRNKTKKELSGSDVDPDHPKLDKTLDTSGLSEFYGRYKPSNHPEKILLFVKFLADELGVEKVNTDHVYTCYMSVKERLPKAFAQSFRDAHGRNYGFIEYGGADVSVTIAGENHYNSGIKKQVAE